MPDAHAPVRRQFRQFAERECRGYSDAYERLALAVAGDDALVEFVAALPVTQPNLLFAAVQCLTGPDDMPRDAPQLRAVLGERGGEVAALVRSRRTQTNEVGRCAVLLPALPPGPLALLEVGASAGLCLLLDRFRYDFGATSLGPATSPVRVHPAVKGPVPLPGAPPAVAWRRGLDLHPLDVRDPAAVEWLLACVWSDHRERRRRLEAAVALARRDPPAVQAGDLVDDLPALLAEAPRDAQLVVFHSAVLTYVSPRRRAAFAGVLADASRRRDVVWLSNEAPGIVPEITALAPPLASLRFLLGRTRFSGGRRGDELLAESHPHGADLTWF